MATTGQAETPKVCDNGSNKLVNGSGTEDYNNPENNNAMKEGYRYSSPYDHPHSRQDKGMEDYSYGHGQYPPYNRGGYDQPPHHNGPDSYQHGPPGYPPMRFPGKPMPGGSNPPPHGYPGPGQRGGGNYPGQTISQQPSGQTPTLNQLLQSPGGANAGASGGNSGQGGHRYPPPPTGGGYEHGYPGPTGWGNRPPPQNSYAHPPPPPFQQPQMYRQSGPGGGGSNSRGGPQQPSGQPQQPPQPYYQHHQGPPPHHPGYPPPPPQSPHYPPPSHQRYPSPGPVMRPPDNQPSHYPPQHPGMAPPESGSEPPKSTPPPPPSPSLANHGQNPPSPSQSPRSTPHPPPVSSANNLPPPSSPSHRPQGPSPSNSYPPDVGDVTGCNSNDSGGANISQSGGPRPSPSPTGSAGSRSMSPAVGNQNIPMPPRPSSSQSDPNASRMSQSPMPGQGPYSGQPMAPPHHHMYQSGGKVPHQGHPPPPPSQSHYPPQQQSGPGQQHWPGQQPGGGYRGPPPPSQQQQHGGHGGGMMGPYPPAQQPMPANNYGPSRHPAPNHVGAPPPPQGPPGGNQYNYPPHYPPPPPGQQPPQWAGGPGGNPPTGTPPHSRSQLPIKQALQNKLGYSPHSGYPMGPPGSGMPGAPPSQTPPPTHHHSEDGGNNPPNLVSVGPDGANVDEVSQQSTISNASGASGGDDGPAMPKLRPEGGRPHYPSTPQSNAVPSPGAASMNSTHEDYGEMNSPGSGWPRTPASPGLNSHPPPPSEHFKGKNKKADSLNKMYDMDDNPERRMFLDKLIRYMEDNSTPIASCPTISKNPLDLFKLYLLVKERGGFLEVSKNKTWKDIAGSLGIGASSSAAYTLRKHYTKHLFPFECKFDRGGIDPLPLINQVETTSKKKGKTAAPVPSPGSSNSQDSFPGPNTNTNSSSMDGFSSNASSSYPSYGQPHPAGGEYGAPPGQPSLQTPSPLSRTPNQSSQQPPHPGGDKSQINIANPFDDQYPQHYPQQSRPNYQYPPYSSQPPSGYPGQGGPPGGAYPPYSQQGDQQYPGRPPVPPHDVYSGQGYARSMYPPYNEAPGGPPPQAAQAPSGYPGQQAQQSQQPGPPQHVPEDSRYMAPPPSSAPTTGPPQPPAGGYAPRGSYPPNQNQGPPGSTPAPPTGSHAHPLPPNGYPSQDYYNSQSQNEQGYPSGGKHMPPPHPGQGRYPTGPGKETPGQYPGYPSPTQGPPQSRVPPYDGPQQASRVGYSGAPNQGPPPRSSPSPTVPVLPPPAPAPPQNLPKNSWNPPPAEGWPNSGAHYPNQQQQQRGYPGPQGPQGASQSPHTPPQGVTPAPAQSPGTPGSAPPQQAISPQPWTPGRSGPPPNSNAQGPPPPPPGASWPPQDPRFGPSSGSMMSPPPSSGPNSQSPWTPPGPHPSAQSRSGPPGGRSPFPGGKPGGDMFRGAGSYGSAPQSLQPPSKSPMPMGPITTPVMPPGGPPTGFQSTVPPTSSSVPGLKKESYFPSDTVEAVTPLLSRRRKLHKMDVAPLEAWRIMMSLKSGLLAETTWALDVLNVLLYDDQSVSYFSLTYLPGLLDILLEHLRKALILLFGPSIGIDITDKLDAEKPKLEWFERDEVVEEQEPDLGTPSKSFPRDSHRVNVLPGPNNYTLTSRFKGKKVRIVSRDDEPFIVAGTRSWDVDEKSRSDPDMDNLIGTLDAAKHIVTYFSTELPRALPIVRNLKEKKITVSPSEVVEKKSSECNLEIYRCESKLPTLVSEPSTMPNTPNPPVTHINTDMNIKKLENGPSSPAIKEEKVALPEPKNCTLFPTPSLLQNSKLNSVVQKKAKRLDDLLGRIRKEQTEDDNALSEAPISVIKNEPTLFVAKEEDLPTSIEVTPPPVLENGISDTPTGGSDNDTNLSAANSDENTCDSSKNYRNVEMKIGDLYVRDPGAALKRKRIEDYEDESYTRDESSLYLVTESQDSLARRCLSLCNIIRNLTFVPGNEMEFGKCVPFLSLMGKLILLYHDHPLKKKRNPTPMPKTKVTKAEPEKMVVEESIADDCDSRAKYDQSESSLTTTPRQIGDSEKSEDAEPEMKKESSASDPIEEGEEEAEEDEALFAEETSDIIAAVVDIDADSCTSLTNEKEWWWDYVHHIREHVLVMIANISGQMDLSQYSEEISRPIIDGLLHWAVCPAAYGQDPFPTLSPGSYLSPQRLALEALVKLSVIQGNVDLLLATPPYSRIERLCQLLCRSLCRTEEQVMREFALNLLYYLSAADSGVARTIAVQNPCISLLISFIEQAEHNAMSIANNHGFSVLRDNPEAMGTSLDMLRRAAMTLLNLARHQDNRPLFVQHEPRLLQLVMSQILEQKVAAMVAQVMYQCSTPDATCSQKYIYTSSTDSFYTPMFSRSRSHQLHHHLG